MSCLRLLILYSVSVCLAFSDENQLSSLDWKTQLLSPDFKKRDEVTNLIWAMGDEALPLLNDLAKTDSPELRARVSKMIQKIERGITPDTPPEMVQIIENYFQSSNKRKHEIIHELKRKKSYDYLLRLHDLENDDEPKRMLKVVVNEFSPQLIGEALLKNDHERALELMLLGDDFTSMIRCGDFLDRRGELERELTRLREKDDPVSQKRYLAYLRVKGDLPLLLKEATRLEDELTVVTAKLLLGEVVPVFEYLLKTQEQSPSDRVYLEWAIAHQKGDLEAEKAALKKIQGFTKDRVEKKRAFGNLYRSTHPELVLETFQEGEDLSFYYEYYSARNLNGKIPEVLEINSTGVSKQWLAELSDKVFDEIGREGNRPKLDQLYKAANYFEFHGLYHEAAKIYQSLFDIFREKSPDHLLSWLSERQNSHIIRKESYVKALIREVEEFKALPEAIVEAMYGTDSSGVWLYHKLIGLDKSLTFEKLLRLLSSFHGDLILDESEYQSWFVKIDERVREDFAVRGSDHGFFQLIEICQQAGRAFEALDLLRFKGDVKDLTLREISLRGSLASEVEDWDDAEACYARLREAQKNVRGKFFVEMEYSFLLERIDGGKERQQKFYDQSMIYGHSLYNGPNYIGAVAAKYHQKYGDHQGAYRILKKYFLRDSQVITRKQYNLGHIESLLGAEATRHRDWKLAAALQEFLIWKSGNTSPQYMLNLRTHSEFFHGMLAFENGDLQLAEKRITAAHALMPSSAALADHFYPALRETGLKDLSDSLCSISLNLCREVIRSYPSDHNARNNFGWIASRGGQNLSEAHDYMKEALRMQPRSEAYLDTMAEVFFAMRHRKEAVKWSRLSLQNKIGDSELHYQNHRFRYGPFPPE